MIIIWAQITFSTVLFGEKRRLFLAYSLHRLQLLRKRHSRGLQPSPIQRTPNTTPRLQLAQGVAGGLALQRIPLKIRPHRLYYNKLLRPSLSHETATTTISIAVGWDLTAADFILVGVVIRSRNDFDILSSFWRGQAMVLGGGL